MSSGYVSWEIDESLIKKGKEAEEKLKPIFLKHEKIKEINQLRVLRAMQESFISESMFSTTTGYGYDDIGRKRYEEAFALSMQAESALVRHSITTGTHALALALYGTLRPNDELLSVTGMPYDTLLPIIGITKEHISEGSLKDYGISFNMVQLKEDGLPNYEQIKLAITNKTKVIFIQRSRGYLDRKTLSILEIQKLIDFVKQEKKDVIVIVDNCYGEFVEENEPCKVGADLCAGSLIKNPGGGIAPAGGYVVGKKQFVERAANRLTAPGIGSHVGATLGLTRLLTQGLFMAPHTVFEAIKGMIFASYMFEKAGFLTSPRYDEHRSDIIQTVKFLKQEQVIKFCQIIQKSAPVDAHVTPEPAPMPGYDCDVIMAAGTFIQGASIELSADAPIKSPYIAFMQGGLVYEQVKLATYLTLKETVGKHE